jgi:thiol:disulfide interchange protein
MRFPALILSFLALLATQTSAWSQTENSLVANASNGFGMTDEFLAVEEAYKLTVEFENKQQLRLNWQIAEAYYLYRHGFSIELIHNGETVSLTPEISSGLEHQDEYFGLVEVYYLQADIFLPAIPASQDLTLAVTSQGCADAGLCYPPHTEHFQLNSLNMTVAALAEPPVKKVPAPDADSDLSSLPYMLILAMLGGVILNLMPCVFPVLSLKALAFARDTEHDHKIQGLVYTAGVVSSFVFIAAILMSLKAAGEAVGWGFHLQSPWFVAGLAYLFFVMGLGLSGLIEMGNSWMNVGGELSSKPGYTGNFFTGVLATVVASPCTAPFMGTALGFAVTQPTLIGLSIFAALGVGMALPLLLLSCMPRLLSKIPKPGPWMETLKQVLAFPLYGTAVWLCWIVGKQAGVNAMGLILLGCTLLALALWLWNNHLWRRSLSAVCAALALSILTSSFLQANSGESAHNWQPYSPSTLAELRQQGKPIFVNITADWCITCLANEQLTLNTEPVKQALIEEGIVYLKGDWTNHDPLITQLLAQYQRTGIPLYLFFPAGSNSEAQLLPQILTSDSLLAVLKGSS